MQRVTPGGFPEAAAGNQRGWERSGKARDAHPVTMRALREAAGRQPAGLGALRERLGT
jgi:hypothetical protein